MENCDKAMRSKMTPGKVNTNDNASNADQSLPTEVSLHRDETGTNDNKDVKKLTVSADTDVSSTLDKSEQKTNDTTQKPKPFDEKLKLDTSEEQLLGSLTSMSSPFGVRTSARVIQKMKMDSIRPTTPPPADKDEHHRNAQKTPNQHRPSKTNWNPNDRALFFDAINEFGKDFDLIANYINGKQKRKNATDPMYKAKEHVRLHYYQTFTKISKYLRFSEDVAKKVQELYALINYGEMRKKIPVDSQKFYMKLRELVYRGSVTWRCKGKNCRIKTPSCPALRKINQVEKWQEDIKLPQKVDVELKPSDDESWYAVQSLAQNPRVKVALPLQKRLISLIKTLQQKWKSREARMWDHMANGATTKANQLTSQSTNSANISSGMAASSSSALENGTNGDVSQSGAHANCAQYPEPVLCIAPPTDVTIHRPYVNLTDFLNSYSICLNSYEERINATIRGETLCAEHISNVKDTIKSNTKRQRHDSGSEKKSPDTKRTKASDSEKFENEIIKKSVCQSTSQDGMSNTEELTDEREFSSPTYENPIFETDDANCHMPESSSADECETEINLWNGTKFKFEPSDELHSTLDPNKKEAVDQRAVNKTTKKAETKSQCGMSKKRELRAAANRESFRPLINEEVIMKIRKGWTIHNVGDMTIGDLYIMFGQDSKVRLEYKWISPVQQSEVKSESIKIPQKPDGAAAFHGKENAVEDDATVKSENVMVGTISTTNDDTGESKSFNGNAKSKNTLSNKLKQLLLLAGMTEKAKRKTGCACGHYCDRGMHKLKQKDEVLPRSFISNKTYPSSHNDSALFRQPVLPTRTGLSHFEPYRLNVNPPRSKQNRWSKPRNTRISKQVVVQRLLPLQPGITQPFGVLTTADVTNYPIEGTMIKTASPVEYKSILTEENLRNHLSTDANSNLPTGSIDITSSNNNNATENFIENSSSAESEHVKCDSGIETCDIIDSEIDKSTPGFFTSDAELIDSDEEENNRMRQRLNEDLGIQSLMEISLPSPMPVVHSADEFYTDGVESQPSISRILRESPVPTDSKWFEENMNDFSLSSFLGHLEANCDQSNSRRSRSPRCMESSGMSTISETSIDYMTRFEELAESMKNESNNIVTP